MSAEASTGLKTIAVVKGAPSAEVQAIFRDFIGRWSPLVRIAGVVEEDIGLSGEVCGAGELRNIGDGSRHPIYQDLGKSSAACRLDAEGVNSACEAVRRDMANGCDLLVLSKFGKLEADRSGLTQALAAAMEAETPVLTSVSPKWEEAWERFAAPLFVVLPADADAIEAWWRSVREIMHGQAGNAAPREDRLAG